MHLNTFAQNLTNLIIYHVRLGCIKNLRKKSSIGFGVVVKEEEIKILFFFFTSGTAIGESKARKNPSNKDHVIKWLREVDDMARNGARVVGKYISMTYVIFTMTYVIETMEEHLFEKNLFSFLS